MGGSDDEWGDASARAFLGLVREPALIGGPEVDVSTFCAPFAALIPRLEAYTGGCADLPADPGARLSDFVRVGLDDDDLIALGLVSREWFTARLRRAVNGQPVTDPIGELARNRLLSDEAWDAERERKTPTRPVGGWPDPAPLDDAAGPALDPRLLPSPLREWVEGVALAYQVPPALPAGMALVVLSACVAGRIRVRLSADWSEETALYVAVVLPSGERKSPVVREAKAPLETWERAAVEANRERVEEEQAAHRVLEKRLAQAEVAASKASGPDAHVAVEEMRALAREVAASKPPVLPRLLADDATPEAIAGLMADHGGRMAFISAEGGLFDLLAGRYSEGRANLDVVLKAHGGEEIRVDRRGRPPEFIPRPTLSLGFAVQPDVLATLTTNDAFRGRGLLARFLFLVPATSMGHREIEPPALPPAVRGAYSARVTELLELGDRVASEGGSANSEDCFRGRELRLSPEAADRMKRGRAALEPRLAPGTGDLTGVASSASKLPGAIARIAALLHLAEHGAPAVDMPISGPTMGAAWTLGELLLAHARVALEGSSTSSRASQLREWLVRGEIERFSARDAFEALKGRRTFSTMEGIEAGLAVLVAAGYVRQEPPAPRPPGRPGRPPSPVYEVNPLIWGPR